MYITTSAYPVAAMTKWFFMSVICISVEYQNSVQLIITHVVHVHPWHGQAASTVDYIANTLISMTEANQVP